MQRALSLQPRASRNAPVASIVGSSWRPLVIPAQCGAQRVVVRREVPRVEVDVAGFGRTPGHIVLRRREVEDSPMAQLARPRGNGGGGRNRTGVDGFAGRCMTTLPPRQERRPAPRSTHAGPRNKRESRCKLPVLSLGDLERETSLELATSTLARLRSTN